MVPDTFSSFFLATSSGGAALIGLLFVATSISPERVFSRSASPVLTAVATSAFTALVNAFFISTTALIPSSNIGYTALVLALIGIINSITIGVRLVWNRWENRNALEQSSMWLRVVRDQLVVVAALIVYVLELSYAARLIRYPDDQGALYSLASIILVVNGLGLLRAWELLGARRGGILGWLNPLRDQDPPTNA
jgi:hypothetical protein